MNTQPGFHNSKSRIAAELGVVLVGLALLVVGLWFGIGFVANRALGSLPADVETALGKQAWEYAVPADERCVNKRTLQYVGDVLRPLLAHQPPGYHFEYTVADDPSVNAMAMPGGYITVNIGLLHELKRSEELAGVLAHELAHVTERHSTRRMASRLGWVTVISLLFGGTDIATMAHLAAELAATAYDRGQESDADTVGLRTLSAAHIDPAGVADLFDRLGTDQPALPALFATHPDPGQRAQLAREAAKTVTNLRPLVALPEELSCR